MVSRCDLFQAPGRMRGLEKEEENYGGIQLTWVHMEHGTIKPMHVSVCVFYNVEK